MAAIQEYDEDDLKKKIGLEPNQDVSDLDSPSPKYCSDNHGKYVVRLSRSVYREGNRNVALAGPYGSGKSSILQKFVEVYGDRAISVSLTTLAPHAKGDGPGQEQSLDENALAEDVTPRYSTPASLSR